MSGISWQGKPHLLSWGLHENPAMRLPSNKNQPRHCNCKKAAQPFLFLDGHCRFDVSRSGYTLSSQTGIGLSFESVCEDETWSSMY